MEMKIKFNEKEISILKRILSYVLSISLMVTGIYAVSFLVELGIIKGQIQIIPVFALHLLQWFLVMRIIFKYYR